VVLALSYLMVSRIRFRSFKDVRPTKKTVGVVLLVAGCWIAMRMNRVHDAFIFLALIAAYIVLGLCEEVVFFRRRIAERRAQQVGQVRRRRRRGHPARRRGVGGAGRVRLPGRKRRARETARTPGQRVHANVAAPWSMRPSAPDIRRVDSAR
jgi:hypothetical protein